jgi:hypothetical protein
MCVVGPFEQPNIGLLSPVFSCQVHTKSASLIGPATERSALSRALFASVAFDFAVFDRQHPYRSIRYRDTSEESFK